MKNLKTLYPNPYQNKADVWRKLALLMPGYVADKMRNDFLINHTSNPKP